jgi:hypothetical protein
MLLVASVVLCLIICYAIRADIGHVYFAYVLLSPQHKKALQAHMPDGTLLPQVPRTDAKVTGR